MSDSTNRVVNVDLDVMAEQRNAAAEFRTMMTERGTLVINLVSSPGAGKTSLLEATAKQLSGSHSMAVLVGDIATERDAERLRPFVPTVQLTTGGACHLQLSLVQRGLSQLPQQHFDFLFVENIGNLVCPASHDLGEHLRVVLLSTTEGSDKPAKYPKMFRTSDALVITKTDLLPYLPFEVEEAFQDAEKINAQLHRLQCSSIDGTGINAWCEWLVEQQSALVGQGVLPSTRHAR